GRPVALGEPLAGAEPDRQLVQRDHEDRRPPGVQLRDLLGERVDRDDTDDDAGPLEPILERVAHSGLPYLLSASTIDTADSSRVGGSAYIHRSTLRSRFSWSRVSVSTAESRAAWFPVRVSTSRSRFSWSSMIRSIF